MPAASWTVLLRVLLGRTTPGYGVTGEGRGILLRLCSGEGLDDLFDDDALTDAVEAIAPVHPATKQANQSHA